MDTQRRSNLIVGLLLLVIGAWFLAVQYIPDLANLFNINLEWPLWIVGLGLVFFISAALARAPGLAIPGAIIGGIGGLLYYQNATGDWDSWAYAWTLIPGFVGVGVMFTNFFEGRFMRGLREGFGLIFFSLIMYGIFGAFLGGPELFADYWPVLLILAGLWMVVRGFLRPNRPPISVDVTIEEDDEGEEVI